MVSVSGWSRDRHVAHVDGVLTVAERMDRQDPSLDDDYCNDLSGMPDFCVYCGAIIALDTHYPYCDIDCALQAELDSPEDN